MLRKNEKQPLPSSPNIRRRWSGWIPASVVILLGLAIAGMRLPEKTVAQDTSESVATPASKGLSSASTPQRLSFDTPAELGFVDGNSPFVVVTRPAEIAHHPLLKMLDTHSLPSSFPGGKKGESIADYLGNLFSMSDCGLTANQVDQATLVINSFKKLKPMGVAAILRVGEKGWLDSNGPKAMIENHPDKFKWIQSDPGEKIVEQRSKDGVIEKYWHTADPQTLIWASDLPAMRRAIKAKNGPESSNAVSKLSAHADDTISFYASRDVIRNAPMLLNPEVSQLLNKEAEEFGGEFEQLSQEHRDLLTKIGRDLAVAEIHGSNHFENQVREIGKLIEKAKQELVALNAEKRLANTALDSGGKDIVDYVGKLKLTGKIRDDSRPNKEDESINKRIKELKLELESLLKQLGSDDQQAQALRKTIKEWEKFRDSSKDIVGNDLLVKPEQTLELYVQTLDDQIADTRKTIMLNLPRYQEAFQEAQRIAAIELDISAVEKQMDQTLEFVEIAEKRLNEIQPRDETLSLPLRILEEANFAVGSINAESISSDKISATLTVDFDDVKTSRKMSEVAIGLKASGEFKWKYQSNSLPKEFRPLAGLMIKALESTKITSDNTTVTIASNVNGANELLKKEGKTRPFIGIYMDEDEDEDGVRITRIVKKSPADLADLRVNDVILKIDEKVSKSPIFLYETLLQYDIGERVTLTVRRGGKDLTIKLTLAEHSTSDGTQAIPKQYGKHSQKVAELLKTIHQEFGNDYQRLRDEHRDLLTKIAEKKESAVLLAYQSDPKWYFKARKVIYKQMLRKIDPQGTELHFDPNGALKIANVLIDGGLDDEETPGEVQFRHVAYQAFRANYAIEDFDGAESMLEKIREKGTKLKRAVSETLKATRKKWEREREIRRREKKANDLPQVKFETTEGTIQVELFENHAPATVGNFIELVEKKFYDDMPFFLVKPGELAQTGCPKGNGTADAGYFIPCECGRKEIRHHFTGTLSMANQGKPDTGGSQFFITHQPNPKWDGKYTAFGRVTKGMDIVYRLQTVDKSKPDPAKIKPSRIIAATVLSKRDHKYEATRIPKPQGAASSGEQALEN